MYLFTLLDWLFGIMGTGAQTHAQRGGDGSGGTGGGGTSGPPPSP